MNRLKKHLSVTFSSMFMVMMLVTAGALEVKANKFDKGYLPPVTNTKARRVASSVISTDGGIWRNRAQTVRVATGDVNGDNILNRHRNRSGARLSGTQVNRNPHTFHLLPYLEQDNLYR